MRANKKWVLADFSPAGSTKKLGTYLVQELSAYTDLPWIHRPFTRVRQRVEPLQFDEDSWVILAMPVYAGRVPSLMLPYLREMKGEGAKVFLLSVYGNRDYEDALREMEVLCTQAGMTVVGGAAFIARHVFSEEIAKGRPDKEDLQILLSKVPSIVEAFEKGEALNMPGREALAYYQPTGQDNERIYMVHVKPSTRSGCIRCLQCVRSCPLGSIDEDDPSHVPGKCMKCFSCVVSCPLKLKHFDDPGFLSHLHLLEQKLTERREPIVYLPGEE